jgi:UPF0755 protein
MPKRIDRRRFRFWPMLGFALVAALAWLVLSNFVATEVAQPVQFSLKQGSGLRVAARHMQAAGVLGSAWRFELLARALGTEGRVQAGNYEVTGPVSPWDLLQKITSGEHRQDKLTIVEGWNFAQLRAALDAHPALRHELRGLGEAEIASRIGLPAASPEGMFYPDTYFFVAGASDLSVLQRAARIMQTQLNALWAGRAEGLPLDNPYQALILASIIEKETGQAPERAMIAAVFANRLRLGMRLQTDPSVIYGLGEKFDGDLRKRDLLTDTPYNSYTRAGLPPTPIAMPGLAALTAALHPAQSRALYFVARGDGSSKFSDSLAEHERAVTKYQRRGVRAAQ